MAYTALYRKYRPKQFHEVVGQPHIVTTLKNQLSSGRLSHAYLFCGTKGTGKTSTAKIFAKALNCENLRDAEPCGVCPACEGIENGRNLNVAEIDAASNNSVDNIRELREQVKYPPSEGKYRVYIIDEVHMLSSGAFNALLKTLEEPPPHVVFILATTDPQKIPATVLSRVQRFDFRRIAEADMTALMKDAAAAEGAVISDDALSCIAGLSEGAMRDALSILDQCVAFYQGEQVGLEKVLELVGAVDGKTLFALTDALAAYDTAACLSVIDEAVRLGRDLAQLVSDCLNHFRNALMALYLSPGSSALPVTRETAQKLKAQAEAVTPDRLMDYVAAFSGLQQDMKYAANQRVLLEVLCMKLCCPAVSGLEGLRALEARLEKLERTDFSALSLAKGKASAKQADEITKPASGQKSEAAPKPQKAETPARQSSNANVVVAGWSKVADQFKMPHKKYLKAVRPMPLADKSIALVCDDLAMPNLLKGMAGDMEAAVQKVFGLDVKLNVMSADEYERRQLGAFSQNSEADGNKVFTDMFGDNIIIE